MAIGVTIKSKGLFKKKLDFKSLIFENMSYGVMNDFFIIKDGYISDITVVYRNDILCRGIAVEIKKGLVNLTLPTPSCEKEIRFFYEYINKICKMMNVKEFYHNDELYDIDCTNRLIKMDIETSTNIVKQICEEVSKKKNNCTYIFGVFNPIAIGLNEAKEIDSNLEKFGNYIMKVQSINVLYMTPRLSKNDNDIIANCILLSDVPTVYPTKKKLINKLYNEDIKNWLVYLMAPNDEHIGTITLEDLLKYAPNQLYYDAEHVLIRLSKNEMKEILKKITL